jgi:hypothetical protein
MARLTLACKMAAIVLTIWKKAVPPAARIEQTVTVGVPIAAVCCERTRLQLRPFSPLVRMPQRKHGPRAAQINALTGHMPSSRLYIDLG